MSNIVILGDIHLADTSEYKRATSEAFLDWFASWEQNTNDNYLILTGDLVDICLLTGRVTDYLERFIASSRFRELHICVGNHDKKKILGIDQLAYEFYARKTNVHYYSEISEISINGKSVLMLPYYLGTNDQGLTMTEYYSQLYKDPHYSQYHDLVVGHFCDEEFSFSGASDTVLNVDKLQEKNGKVCLGHIHTRNINPGLFIGSTWACKKNENDPNRAAWVMDESGCWHEEKLPVFCEYLEVSYPDPLPESKAMVPIYTVLNCASEQIARSQYGDIYIRKTVAGENEHKSKQDTSISVDSVKGFDILEYFDTFWETSDIKDNKEAYTLCRQALEKRA